MEPGIIATIIGYINLLPDWLQMALTVVGSFAVVATVTPTQVDDKAVSKADSYLKVALNWALRLKEFLAFNFGQARNQDDPPVK